MTNQTAQPLAEIKLSPERPTIDVDGERYALRLLEYDFSVVEHHELERSLERFDALWEKDRLNRKEKEQLEAVLQELFGRVTVDWPADVVAKLTDVQKRQVISVFQIAPQLTAALRAQQDKTQKTPTAQQEDDSTSAS